jgi:hypothetical protein
MKRLITSLLLFGFIAYLQKVNAVTTQLVLNSKVLGFLDNRCSLPLCFPGEGPEESMPIIKEDAVKITLTYNSNQVEDDVEQGMTHEQQLAYSSYTITNGSIQLDVGSYTWFTTTCRVELGNNYPFLTPQDFLTIRFRAAPPPEFAFLGYDEPIDDFYMRILDYQSMTFLSDTSLPIPGSNFKLESLAMFGGAPIGISGEPIIPPFNWTLGALQPTSYSITTIPEPQTYGLLGISVLLTAFCRKRRKP